MADGRVCDSSGATVCLCYQLPLDQVTSAAKAQFIATACNAYREHLAALEDLLGDLPNVQPRNGTFVCVHCDRDYGCGDIGEDIPHYCDSDDCPSFMARHAVAVAKGNG